MESRALHLRDWIRSLLWGMRISANAADGAHWHHLAISNDPVDEERDDKETEERDAKDFPVQM